MSLEALGYGRSEICLKPGCACFGLDLGTPVVQGFSGLAQHSVMGRIYISVNSLTLSLKTSHAMMGL